MAPPLNPILLGNSFTVNRTSIRLKISYRYLLKKLIDTTPAYLVQYTAYIYRYVHRKEQPILYNKTALLINEPFGNLICALDAAYFMSLFCSEPKQTCPVHIFSILYSLQRINTLICSVHTIHDTNIKYTLHMFLELWHTVKILRGLNMLLVLANKIAATITLIYVCESLIKYSLQ